MDDMFAEEIFTCPSDTPEKLWDIVEEYLEGRLRSPEHQRDTNAWNDEKKIAWIERLIDASRGKRGLPLGTICTYDVKRERGVMFLNDGLQRITTCIEAIQNPKKFGFRSSDEVTRMLKGVKIVKQYRPYTDHEEAALDFEEVNKGTGLHSAERFKRVLVYMKNWTTIWKTETEKFISEVQNVVNSYTESRTDRNTKLGTRRKILCLLCVALFGRPLEVRKNSDLIEQTLNKELPERTVEDLTKALNAIIRHSADIETAWRKIKPNHAEVMQFGLAWWTLCISLLHAKNFSVSWWSDFLSKLFNKTGGGGTIVISSEGQRVRNIFLTKEVSNFDRVCSALRLEIPATIRQNLKGQSRVKRGYHRDHKLPFADFGNGETQILSARQNMAKSARHIEPIN